MTDGPRLLTAKDLHDARVTLGRRHYGRMMLPSEMGRALRLAGRDPGEGVRNLEARRGALSGPISQCLEMWLAGATPAEGWTALRKHGA